MADITNFTGFKIDKGFLEKIIGDALKIADGKKIKGISLVLINPREIKKINRQYRRKNETTDVLSFEGLNEIFICPFAVKKQAKRLKTSFGSELMRVLIHGILHLKGYEHEKSANAAERMKKTEEKILQKINGKAKK